MKLTIKIIGYISLATGLLWVGQGLGYIHWPASSFMINQVIWTYYGLGLAGIGLLFIWLSRRN